METRSRNWPVNLPSSSLFWTILAALAVGTVMLRLFDPATAGFFPPCPVHYLTGWYCPGCGSLRAIHQLLHGEVRAAWAFNPLTILLLPFLLYGLASEARLALSRKPLPQPFLRAGWIRGLCGVILLFGIVRNFPGYPFELLAPGAMLRL